MSTPKISVVMPVYNSEKYLRESIESILDQTFTDFEFIIVDDQSTDSSWQIIQEYAKKDPKIVAVKNSGKKGCYPARNCGHRLAKGKYIAVMDSDDIALPERLQTQFDFMEQNPDIDICGSWMKNFGANDRITKLPTNHEDIRDLTFFGCAVGNNAAFFKRNLNLEYATDFNCSEDYELWCRKIDELKFANIPEILLLYRVHESQISTGTKKNQNDVANEIRCKNLKKIDVNLSTEEQKIYNDFFSDQFIPHKINEVTAALNIFEKISAAGKNFGYGEKFQERIKGFQRKITDLGIKNKITSLILYFTTFKKIGFLDTPRANLRYVFHCLRNIWR